MRKFLLNFIKMNKWIYDLYYYVGSFLIRFLGIFAKTDENCILFVSFAGKRFDDSPKAIYDEMIKLDKFKNLKYYWAFVDCDKFNPPQGEKIRIDTFKYFWIAQKSKIWITNSAIERGLNFKKKQTFYINTWHGTPLKKIGKDEHSKSNKSGLGSKNISTEDVILAQSEYDAHIFSHIFNMDFSKIITCDLPRNDELSEVTKEYKENIRKQLNIEENKKIILYAPTYREYERDKYNECSLNQHLNFENWKRKLGKDYIILFRAHYEVVKVVGLKESDFVRDVSSYEKLNELMIASDILISDYSSIFFDYSILEKPMFCFAYDLEKYMEKRGLYFDLERELPCDINKNEHELLQNLLYYDSKDILNRVKLFKQKYAPSAGNATQSVIKIIEENIKK